MKWISEEIVNLKENNLFNNIKVIDSAISGKIIINGKEYLNFSSNNYLGLANDERIKNAAIEAIQKFGVGPGAVRTIAGTTSLHAKLEENLAKFKKAEAVITFQSGFTANLAVIPALVGEKDFIFSDELNHASIIDACRLSKAKVIRYAHSDISDLKTKINENFPKPGLGIKGLIVTDGVFSMDGDIAKLPELVKVAKENKLMLMVDDAHGEGVLGKGGRGIVDHFDLHGQVDIEIGTMSKAFGVMGGMVAGSKDLIEWLSQRARPFLFSSALTIPDTAACLKAVEILEESDELVKKLHENADYMKENLKKFGYDIGNSQTPIIPIMLGEAKKAQEMAIKLFDNGLFAKAIAYPTVPINKARIRLMNTAAHSKEDLDKALKIFKEVN